MNKNYDTRVASIFNEMRFDYDDLTDLWYAWLFSRLHFFITKNIINEWREKPIKVLDIGCGTGFQSFLYAACGADVYGIDIADDLIFVANQKAKVFQKIPPLSLFPSHFNFVKKYDKKISDLLRHRFEQSNYAQPLFQFGNATKLDFESNSFDHVNCCGSTLNYIDDHMKALSEISRVLKSGGTFVIEVDSKINLDLFWMIFDSLSFGILGFETKLKDAIKLALIKINSHSHIEYPFGDVKNPVYMDLKLYKKSLLVKECEKNNLIVKKINTIHSITNLIPSTFLDSSKPSKTLKGLFYLLSKIEELSPIKFPGCSLVLFGIKQN